MDLSIIIVTYNSNTDIERCLDSVIEHTKEIKYEVCVIDNSSTDNTVELVQKYVSQYSNIKCLSAPNRGFNAGNNIGIKQTTGEYIALLNPDTILLNNAFKIILEGMNSIPNVGVCGGSLFNLDMTPAMSHGSFPTLKETFLRATRLRNDSTYYLADNTKKVMLVDYPSGADFVFKRNLISQIGWLDEDYFLYFDETDYAFKIKQLGLKNYLFTEAKIIHAQGSSTDSVSEFAQNTFLESFAKYLNKHVSKLEAKSLIYIRITELYVKKILFSILKPNDLKKKRFYENELNNYYKVLSLID